jgi:hypothetical protein
MLLTPDALRLFFLGRGFTIGQAAQRAPQKTTDPALAGSVRTRCPRTHNWCDRHTPHPSARAAGVPVGATYIAAVPGASILFFYFFAQS